MYRDAYASKKLPLENAVLTLDKFTNCAIHVRACQPIDYFVYSKNRNASVFFPRGRHIYNGIIYYNDNFVNDKEIENTHAWGIAQNLENLNEQTCKAGNVRCFLFRYTLSRRCKIRGMRSLSNDNLSILINSRTHLRVSVNFNYLLVGMMFDSSTAYAIRF